MFIAANSLAVAAGNVQFTEAGFPLRLHRREAVLPRQLNFLTAKLPFAAAATLVANLQLRVSLASIERKINPASKERH